MGKSSWLRVFFYIGTKLGVSNQKLIRRKGSMKLKNVLIVVENIEEAKKFYHDLFGLETVLDNEGNMIRTEI